jgi:hypothetical protein
LVPVSQPVRRGQAQLAINALPVRDPAMTPEEWTEVVQAYDAFAAATNASRAREAQRSDGRSYLARLEDPDGLAMVDLATLAVGVLQLPVSRAS